MKADIEVQWQFCTESRSLDKEEKKDEEQTRAHSKNAQVLMMVAVKDSYLSN